MKNLKVGTKIGLLILIFIIGSSLFGGLAFYTLDKIKINGALYGQIVNGKDVIADILPPPEYIIETQLTAYELVQIQDPAKQETMIKKASALESDFVSYHDLLEQQMTEGELKNTLLVESYQYAVDYYKIFDSDFLNAIQAKKFLDAETILAEQLTPLYDKHRSAVDKAVSLASEENKLLEDRARTLVNRNQMILAAVFVLVLAVAIVFCLLITRAIIKPLKFVTAYLQNVSDGNLKGMIPPELLGSRDELGDIANATSNMQSSLVQMIQQTKKLASEVASMSVNMAESANASGKVSEQISDSVATIADGAHNEMEDITNIQKQVEDSRRHVEDGFEKTSSMLITAKSSSEIAETGSGYISNVIEQFAWVSKTVEFATESVQNLGKRSAEIYEITEVITGIASQTNLLALNASIEAARAGDSGRGFAVVAEKIRQLSENTAVAATKIAELLADIKSETDGTVKTMESNLEKVNTQISSIQKGGEALKSVVDNVEQTEKDVQEVYELYELIQEKTETISVTTREISDIITGSAAFTEEVSSATQEQYSAIVVMDKNAVELAKLADQLKEQVEQFTV